jgi:hypothetical protein
VDNLPGRIQSIINTEKQRPRRTWPHARHIVEFLFDPGPDGSVTVARFAAYGPITIPAVGEQFNLHRTVVSATDVHTSYQAGEDGSPVIHTTVSIALVD